MKELSVFLLAAFTVWLAVAEVPVGESVVMNGRWACDQNDTPQFWTVAKGLVTSGHVVFSASGGPDGLPSLKVSAADTNVLFGTVARQFGLTLAAGERYRLSCRIRTQDFEPVGGLALAVVNAGWKAACGFTSFPRSTDWTELTKEFVAPASKDGQYSVCFHVCRLTGRAEVADLRIDPLSEKARLGAARSAGAEIANEPRLVPWRPRLCEIPSDARTVEFRFFGRLPAGKTFSDYVVTVKPDDVVSAVRVPLAEGVVPIRLPDEAKAGRLSIRVGPVAGGKPLVDEVRRYAVVPPAAAVKAGGKELNMLVTELVNASAEDGAGTFRFATQRKGWVYVSVGGGTAKLDGRTVIETAMPQHETFREIASGEHVLEVSGACGRVIVRRVPEILNYPIGVNSPVPENPPYDWAFAERHVLPATTTQNGGTLTDAQAAALHARGGKWLANLRTTSVSNAADLVNRLRTSKGLNGPCYDGVTCDEQFFQRSGQIALYTQGLKAFDAEDDSGRAVYTWIVGNASSSGLDRDFAATCVNASCGRGKLISEIYCRTRPTEASAREYLADYLKGAASNFAGVCPDALRSSGLILGNFTQIPVISLVWHPEVDYKYYLDLQLNLMANDPAFRGLGCVGYWGSYYADEEMHRWSMALMRHYFVEGNRTMLSAKYGYAYIPGHLVNGDFNGSFDGWTKTGAVSLDSIANFGTRSEGRWGGSNGQGDTFAVLKRGTGEGNALRQTVRGLVPGRAYCLQAAVFDVKDAQAKVVRPARLPLDIRLGSGAERIDRLSWVHVDKRENKRKKDVSRINLHHVVFRATAESVEIALEDAAAALGTELGINCVSVNPYYEEPGFALVKDGRCVAKAVGCRLLMDADWREVDRW